MEWVKYSDQRPKEGERILVLDGDGTIFMHCNWEGCHWDNVEFFGKRSLTHWCSLPQPPEKVKR